MKRIITLIVILTMAFAISAQSNYSPCYTSNMSKGNTAFSQGRYSEARTYYANAKQCAGGNPSEAQQKINACDAKIKAQKEAAEAKQRAEQEAAAERQRMEEESKKRAEQDAAIAKRKAEEKAAIIARGFQEITVNGVSFKMIYVEGGTFQMGATSEQGSDAYDDEKPAHSVTLSDFCICETEVTQALWKAVMGTEPSCKVGSWSNMHGKGNDYPAYSVSWNDCQEFIKKLNQLTGKTFRLPTEAEWEYAARGGNKSRHYKYAGSNNIDNAAWYSVNSSDKGISSPDFGTHPVKGKMPNELGLYDMSGNVWEWCQNGYDSYNSSAQTNPFGPSASLGGVLRGGNWDSIAKYCRVSNRRYSDPDSQSDNGFRLVLVP